MNILILSRKFSIYSTRRLVEEIQARGHTSLLWDPAWPASKYRTSFAALIPRLGSFQFEQACEALKNLSSHGGLILNETTTYQTARNKWSSHLVFLENKIATPYSEYFPAGQDLLWKKDFPCIVKKLEASKGDGVFLVRTEKDLAEISMTHNSDSLLVQEAFPECFGEDIRAFVVGGKIIACMKRKSTQDFRSNLALGGMGEICLLTSTEEDLVLKTVTALKLQIAGVDLLRTHRGSLILEANPCPGLEGIEKYTQVNVARAIIQHIESFL